MREGGGDSRGVGENRAKEVEKGEQEQESRVNAAKKFLKFFHSAIGRSRTLQSRAGLGGKWKQHKL